jgi:hypothetical protein
MYIHELNGVELGWLAGTLDGEASVGISTDSNQQLKAAVQMVTTDETTARCVSALFVRLGLRSVIYKYQEKHPERQKDYYTVRVVRLADLEILARTMEPVSVTKNAQWRLLLQFVRSRLTQPNRKYTDAERSLHLEMRDLNRRGPRP